MIESAQRSEAAGSRGGFSLLEVMVALMILMIGLTSLILVFAQGSSLQARGKRAMDSTRLAQSIASELQYLANEHGVLPESEKENNRQIVSSHAGWSDRYRAEVSYARLNMDKQVPGNLSYAHAAYLVRIKVMYRFRGEQKEEMFHTAVVVSK